MRFALHNTVYTFNASECFSLNETNLRLTGRPKNYSAGEGEELELNCFSGGCSTEGRASLPELTPSLVLSLNLPAPLPCFMSDVHNYDFCVEGTNKRKEKRKRV